MDRSNPRYSVAKTNDRTNSRVSVVNNDRSLPRFSVDVNLQRNCKQRMSVASSNDRLNSKASIFTVPETGKRLGIRQNASEDDLKRRRQSAADSPLVSGITESSRRISTVSRGFSCGLVQLKGFPTISSSKWDGKEEEKSSHPKM